MNSGWEVIVMGSGQDAGVPQVGCSCKQCSAARSDPAARRLAPSLLVKNDVAGQAIIIDASPDIRKQLDRYLPPLPLRAVRARSADLALIDGTFFSAEELGGMRAMQEIPHPPYVRPSRRSGTSRASLELPFISRT